MAHAKVKHEALPAKQKQCPSDGHTHWQAISQLYTQQMMMVLYLGTRAGSLGPIWTGRRVGT
eukprot:64131-Rhodomonas_salina.1